MKSKFSAAALLSPPAAPRRQRWRKWILLALALYTVGGFFLLPAVIKWQLRQQLPALTHRQAAVQSVRCNPYALSLTVRGLALTETNGTAFVAFDKLYVNFQLSSIFRGAWTFAEIRLERPTASVWRYADGQFNFSNLVTTNAPSAHSPGAPPAVLVQRLLITNAIVSFADETTPEHFRSDYGPLHLELKNFTTRPNADGPYSLAISTTDGESFTWTGDISINPLRSHGQFELSGIPPRKYGPYLAQFSTVRVVRGTLKLGASYRFNAAAAVPELDVTNAIVEVRQLEVRAPDRDVALLAVADFKISDTSANLTTQQARIGRVELRGGSAFVSRETNGQLTARSYLLARPPGPGDAVTETNAPTPWQWELGELDVRGFDLAIEDHAAAGVAELGLDQISLQLQGVANASNAPVALRLGCNWRGGGNLDLTARGTLLPPRLEVELGLTNFALAPLQPYFGRFAHVVVHAGELNVNSVAEFDPAREPVATLRADVSIANFNASDTVAFHELAVWENLVVRGIDFSWQTNFLGVAEIKLSGARNNFVINSNGVLNVAALVQRPPGSNAPAEIPTASAPAPFPIRIGAVQLDRNALRVADDSLPRRFEFRADDLFATVRNVVLPGLERAEIEVRGQTGAQAPFAITGHLTPDPQNLFVALQVTATNTDLTPLSPYTEKYVGRTLTRGKLTTALAYQIENRALRAANVVALDHLTLGGRVESPEATKLPVKLAIGLLKDMNGQIALDVPLAGSLDDPKFSIWGLVGQTLQNLVLKVAASPFSLLGALAGGGAELQFVDFDYGRAALNDSQTNKLMQLATALEKRPALGLEIGASYDPVGDGWELGRQKVLAQMQTLAIEEIVARGRPAPARAELQFPDAEYERLLRKAYRAAFQTTPEQAVRETLAAALAAQGEGAVGVSAAPPRADQVKGASALMHSAKSLAQLAAAVRGTNANQTTPGGSEPKSEAQLVRDELEQRLATLTPVTSEDLRTLLRARIEVVQKFLLESAGVAADRVLVTSVDPEHSGSQGLARVLFTLE